MKERFLSFVSPEPNSGCWLWTGSLMWKGYGNFNSGGGCERAHRVSWKLFVGPIPQGAILCHRCDTPACVNPDHLYAGTPKQNTRDMMVRGRHKTRPHHGHQNGNSIFTPEQVKRIRDGWALGRTTGDMAAEYGASRSAIWGVATGRRYKAVDGCHVDVRGA